MSKLGIVVPYRDRPKHLEKFKGFFKEHSINVDDYKIFIIEQHDNNYFNRAKLLNVGFDIAKDEDRHECEYFAFHDIDMLPLEADYGFPDKPTHIATKVEQFGWGMPYSEYFGGVTLFNKEDFLKINGYSNEYWGWGAEDDDIRLRCQREGLEIERRQSVFESLSHPMNGPSHGHYQNNVNRLNKFSNEDSYKDIYKQEGYSILDYQMIDEEQLLDTPEMYLNKVKL